MDQLRREGVARLFYKSTRHYSRLHAPLHLSVCLSVRPPARQGVNRISWLRAVPAAFLCERGEQATVAPTNVEFL